MEYMTSLYNIDKIVFLVSTSSLLRISSDLTGFLKHLGDDGDDDDDNDDDDDDIFASTCDNTCADLCVSGDPVTKKNSLLG